MIRVVVLSLSLYMPTIAIGIPQLKQVCAVEGSIALQFGHAKYPVTGAPKFVLG
jgi:hypothetical protein